jgi:hypothetical protein
MVKINFKTIKWISVVITIIAALSISLRMTNIVISYYIFLVGAYILYKEKDWSLFFMNMVWVLIDVIGIVKWS